MTPKSILNKVASAVGPNVLTLGPGPIRLRVSDNDTLAARLLLWLETQMPASATQGDLDDVLACAQWWSMFLASLEDGSRAGGSSSSRRICR
jgi:hypothetical protein